MPRKAKPLSLFWSIKREDGSFCGVLQWTRAEAILEVCDGPDQWKRLRKHGYRAVRVTVREE